MLTARGVTDGPSQVRRHHGAAHLQRRRLIAVLVAVVLLAVPVIGMIADGRSGPTPDGPESAPAGEAVATDDPVVEPGLDRFQLIPLAPGDVTFQFLEHRADGPDGAPSADQPDGREAGTRI